MITDADRFALRAREIRDELLARYSGMPLELMLGYFWAEIEDRFERRLRDVALYGPGILIVEEVLNA